MPRDLPAKPETHPRWLLRRLDQAAVAVAILFCLAAMILWWISQGGLSNRLVEVERAGPANVRFEVDVNSAGWPELVQLPGVGETLAKRIVASQEGRPVLRSRGPSPGPRHRPENPGEDPTLSPTDAGSAAVAGN